MQSISAARVLLLSEHNTEPPVWAGTTGAAFEVIREGTLEAVAAQLEQAHIDAVVIDSALSEKLDHVVQRVRDTAGGTPVLIMTPSSRRDDHATPVDGIIRI